MSAIDFAEVKRLVKLRFVLEFIGWCPSCIHGPQQRGPCPLHGSRSPRSRSFAVRAEGWYCHVCHRGGDAIDLWAEYAGLNVLEAAAALCHKVGVRVPFMRDASREEHLLTRQGLLGFPPEQEEERSGGRGVSPRSSPSEGPRSGRQVGGADGDAPDGPDGP